jgi:hypothetical protein
MDPEWVKLQLVEKKVKNQEVVYQLNHGLKVAKVLYIVEFQREDLIMLDLQLRFAIINLSDLNRFNDGDTVTPRIIKGKRNY